MAWEIFYLHNTSLKYMVNGSHSYDYSDTQMKSAHKFVTCSTSARCNEIPPLLLPKFLKGGYLIITKMMTDKTNQKYADTIQPIFACENSS